MVNIGVSNKCNFFHCIKFRNYFFEQILHFIPVIRITRINKQILTVTFYDGSIASARRLYQNYFCPVGNDVPCHTR